MPDDERLLRGFTVTHVRDCLADPAKNRVIAELWDNVSPAFPYLNAVVPNLTYAPGASIMMVRRGERLLTFYPHVAVMAKVDGEEDAVAQLCWFQGLCNDIWRRRGELTPCYERRRLLGPLDVYRLLPQLNCRACGEATCMAFAFGLLAGEHRLAECPPLTAPQHAEARRRLAELMT
ncbi:MAG: Fe-S cluster protein [Chloroflexi bacterium]|nr:Fe-S cluster protein [Chloroflexota bacterium]MBU1751432.1 Fe-S cluster protein [Chloroflexota bacterium]MBU1880231.1 Fe-S cluster protein [Chloroflexota bacterium]